MDVAVLEETNPASFEAVVFAGDGSSLDAFNGMVHCLNEPCITEALAVSEALSWLKGSSWNNIIIQTYYQTLCRTMNALIPGYLYTCRDAKWAVYLEAWSIWVSLVYLGQPSPTRSK